MNTSSKGEQPEVQNVGENLGEIIGESLDGKRIDSVLSLAKASLDKSGSSSPALDAELILASALGRDRTWLFTWPEYQPSFSQIDQFNQMLQRRVLGEPMAYILGEREFWGLSLECDPSTLIPRPDTELLVEIALGLGLTKEARILDLGTGTGAIALALASERPNWKISAVDLSTAAIDLAQRNAAKLGIGSVEWYRGSWFEPIEEGARFDLIISNPPYVEAGSPWLDRGDLRFEPRTALTSGLEGMDDISLIAKKAQTYLSPSAYLLFEHGFEQADKVKGLLQSQGYQSIKCFKDLSDLDRATLAINSSQ